MSVTYYLPDEAGWQSSGASTAYSVRMKLVRSYDAAANKSTYTVSLQAKGSAGVYGGSYQILSDGTISGGGKTLYTFVQTDANRVHQVSIDQSGTWYDVTSVYNPSSWTFSVQHADNGSSTVHFGIDLRLYGYISGGARYGDFYSRTASLTVSEARASSIVSCPTSVATQGTLALSMNRASTVFYHKATLTDSQGRTLYSSGAFATALSISVPRTWFNNYPSVTSFTAKLSVQTYTSSACTTAVGSPATANVKVSADSGMTPTLASGFASAAPYGNPTGFTGYIQGKSRARVTLTASRVTHASGASLASYKVVCQSYTGTGTGTVFDTNVLSGTAAVTITVTVTDSRGRTASTSLSVTPLAYAAPTLSAVNVFRSDSGGKANDDGTYISAKATAACSGLNGQNSVTLSCRWRPVGGALGTAVTLKSGAASVLGGSLDPDKSYEVLLTATDTLGTATTTSVTLATRTWAMKFRPTGSGVAFGKAAEHDKALEIPADWMIYRGAQPLILEYHGNPNLLDNWYLGRPIDQRGEGSYSGNTYTVDRWYSSNTRGVVTVGNGYTRLAANSSGTAFLRQRTENSYDIGTDLTVSAIIRGNTSGYIAGTIADLDGTNEVTGSTYFKAFTATNDWTLYTFTFSVTEAGKYPQIAIRNDNSSGTGYLDIKAAKMELGKVQTLAFQNENGAWVLNDPIPNASVELAKCQRYQIPIARYFREPFCAVSANYVDASFPLPVTLRATPEIIGEGLTVYAPSAQTDFTFSVAAVSPNTIRIRATKNAHGFSLGDGAIGCDSNVLLDANL